MKLGSLLCLGAVVLLVAACASTTATTTAPTRPPDAPIVGPTSVPARFDLAAVKATFTGECNDSSTVDELLCQEIKIAEMTADGTTLYVPTTLDQALARADAFCSQLARSHFDANGKALGYEEVAILDKGGRDIATCSVY